MSSSKVPAADSKIDQMLALANLSSTDEERTLLAKQIPEILKFSEVLSNFNTEGVEPMYGADWAMLYSHPDTPEDSLPAEVALGQSDLRKNSHIRVPKVL